VWFLYFWGDGNKTMEKVPMTAEGHKALVEELKHRQQVERQRIIQAISEARAHGDLSENAEYHAAKEQQSLNEGRIAELEDKLSRAEIIDMYQQLRPGRSSHAELIALATRLEDVYVAPICGAFVREAAQVYLERNMLRRPPAF
jgi:hypothetical protein